MPIRQFFYFDAIECLPESIFQTPSSEATTESKTILKLPTKKTRYYSQEIVFGEDFQDRLGKSKYFVVSRSEFCGGILVKELNDRLVLVQLVVKC